jgi:salicylate hydroxylase
MSILQKTSKIAIVGGGISGFSLALALQRNNYLNVNVYEKDSTLEARRQGYSLTINRTSRTALKELKIFNEVRKEDMRSSSHFSFTTEGNIIGFFGLFLHPETVRNNYNMHLPRQTLRKILFNNLIDNTVVWNKQLNTIEDSNRDDIKINFMDGSREKVDLLIGADGINSIVKKRVLPDAKLKYLGVLIVLGITPIRASKDMTLQMVGDGMRLYSMPFDHENIMWQISFEMGEEDAKELSKNPSLLKEEILRRCNSWAQPIHQIIKDTKVELIMGCAAYDSYEAEEWQIPSNENNKIIMLGDSIHPMCPFKGQGANQAILDAQSLSKCLTSFPLKEAITTFYSEMKSRCCKKMLVSRQKIDMLHQEDNFSSSFLQFSRAKPEFIAYLKRKNIGIWDLENIEQILLQELKIFEENQNKE